MRKLDVYLLAPNKIYSQSTFLHILDELRLDTHPSKNLVERKLTQRAPKPVAFQKQDAELSERLVQPVPAEHRHQPFF